MSSETVIRVEIDDMKKHIMSEVPECNDFEELRQLLLNNAQLISNILYKE